MARGGQEEGCTTAAAGARGARRGRRRVAGGQGGEGGGGGGTKGHNVRRKKGSRAPLACDPSQHNVVLLHVPYEPHLIAKPKNKLHVFFHGTHEFHINLHKNVSFESHIGRVKYKVPKRSSFWLDLFGEIYSPIFI